MSSERQSGMDDGEVRFLARRLSRVSGCALGRRVEVREEGQVVKRLKEKTAMKYFWPILK